MISIPSDQVVYFDVDDTLVKWDCSAEDIEKEGISIICPESYCIIDGELTRTYSWTQNIVPHKKHVEQLKLHKSRGHTVVVWSMGGWDWAKTVVHALNLEKYVDLVISKPTWTYDDLQPNEFISKPIWMEDK